MKNVATRKRDERARKAKTGLVRIEAWILRKYVKMAKDYLERLRT